MDKCFPLYSIPNPLLTILLHPFALINNSLQRIINLSNIMLHLVVLGQDVGFSRKQLLTLHVLKGMAFLRKMSMFWRLWIRKSWSCFAKASICHSRSQHLLYTHMEIECNVCHHIGYPIDVNISPSQSWLGYHIQF